MLETDSENTVLKRIDLLMPRWLRMTKKHPSYRALFPDPPKEWKTSYGDLEMTYFHHVDHGPM